MDSLALIAHGLIAQGWRELRSPDGIGLFKIAHFQIQIRPLGVETGQYPPGRCCPNSDTRSGNLRTLPVPEMEHRIVPEYSCMMENTKVSLAGGCFFIPYKFVPARGRGNAAPFDSGASRGYGDSALNFPFGDYIRQPVAAASLVAP